MHHCLAYAIILTILLINFSIATIDVQAGYRGGLPAPSGITLYSVCGDASQGLLFAVGNSSINGLVYKVNKLSINGYEIFIDQSPEGIGKQYQSLSFYACEVVDGYLFVVGEAKKRSAAKPDGIVIVYNISGGNKIDDRACGERIIDVEVQKKGGYHIYALVYGSSNTVMLSYTTFVKSIDAFSNIALGSGDGYGISLHGDYLGVLWKSSNDLVLSIFNVSSRRPRHFKSVTIISGFTGDRATEAAYSEGFIVAASSNIFKVYFNGSSNVLVESTFNGDAYAMLVSEKNGAKAAYVFTMDENISIIAVDIARGVVAYIDEVADGVMNGFGDAYVVWIDNDMNIVSAGSESSKPYMVYAARNCLIYYNLTQGGVFPYPIPEPWLTTLVVLVVTAILTLLSLEKAEVIQLKTTM